MWKIEFVKINVGQYKLQEKTVTNNASYSREEPFGDISPMEAGMKVNLFSIHKDLLYFYCQIKWQYCMNSFSLKNGFCFFVLLQEILIKY